MAMWIKGKSDGCQCTVCSNCGSIIPTETVVSTLSKEDNRYCYFCGRKMEEAELAPVKISDLAKYGLECGTERFEIASYLYHHLNPFEPLEPFGDSFLFENISHTAFKELGENDE